MQWLYPWLHLAHVLLVIVAVGFNLSYAIWIRHAERQPRHLGHTLRGVKLLDDRFANPAYALLLVTGFGMVIVGGLDLGRFWLGASLGLYILVVVIGLALYTPTLREQIEVLETHGPEHELFGDLRRRAAWLGAVLGLLVLVIVALMVLKPGG